MVVVGFDERPPIKPENLLTIGRPERGKTEARMNTFHIAFFFRLISSFPSASSSSAFAKVVLKARHCALSEVCKQSKILYCLFPPRTSTEYQCGSHRCFFLHSLVLSCHILLRWFPPSAILQGTIQLDSMVALLVHSRSIL